jgi:GntR family transcriptional regulator
MASAGPRPAQQDLGSGSRKASGPVGASARAWKRMRKASHPHRDREPTALLYSAQWCGRLNSPAADMGTVRHMIDRDSHVPPWMQLAEILRERIRKGEITNRLPGERSLQQEFGLAPVTIRKAVRKLAEEGMVRTTPGMGSFVVKPSRGSEADPATG